MNGIDKVNIWNQVRGMDNNMSLKIDNDVKGRENNMSCYQCLLNISVSGIVIVSM